MNRRNAIAMALGIGVLLVLGWFLFGGEAAKSPGPAGAPGVAASGPAGAPGGRPGGMREVAVSTANPTLKDFAHEVEALGTLRANESVDITAKLSDRVAAIRFKEGQQVRAREVLVELDSVEERADLAAAEASLADSRSQYNRSRELYQTRALSEAQLDQLQATLSTNEARVAAARSRLSDTIIVAPFSGRVGLRNVSLGSLVNPGGVITTLDDLSVMKLDFSVPEVFLSSLKQGQDVGARSSAYAGEVFRGHVGSIDTRVDPATRSVAIRAIIENRDDKLRPGMFMTVTLTRSEGKAMMLPEEAIVPEDNRHFVFLVQDGRAVKKAVEIGRRRPGEVEILNGLSVEDRVVVDGTVNLRNGVPVRLIERAANPPPAAQPVSTAMQAPGSS